MTYPLYPHASTKKPDPSQSIESISSHYAAELTKMFPAEYVFKAIHTSSRKAEIALVRHCFRYLLNKHFASTHVAEFLKCDHTTVLHSSNYVNDLLPIQNKKLHNQLLNILKP